MSISDNTLLRVNHLNTGYGKHQVLFNISLEVKRGEIALLMGGNGSGKSTLLKAIYGLIPKWNIVNDDEKSNKCVVFQSKNITSMKTHQLIRKGIVYVPQKDNTFDQLTVSENLEMAITYVQNGNAQKKRMDEVFNILPILAKLQNRLPFFLSGGEKQQLALGMALMQRPKLVMLDEPSAGLSPKMWTMYLETISTLNEQGITFLIVEHKVKEIMDKAQNILQIKLGKIITKIR